MGVTESAGKSLGLVERAGLGLGQQGVLKCGLIGGFDICESLGGRDEGRSAVKPPARQNREAASDLRQTTLPCLHAASVKSTAWFCSHLMTPEPCMISLAGAPEFLELFLQPPVVRRSRRPLIGLPSRDYGRQDSAEITGP